MGTLQWHHVHSPKVGTLQWHPAMAPHPLPQSWSPPYPPTIAHCNGTLPWHPAMAARPLLQSWSSPTPQPQHTTMAPYDGTQQLPQSWSSPSPLMEVRIPIAIAIWEKLMIPLVKSCPLQMLQFLLGVLKYIGHPFPFSSNMENWLSN